MSLRKTLPRAELRKLDDMPGKYPSILRTGDSTRKGNLPVFFDDNTTILYGSSGTAITWPSTLPISGNLQADFTSSITTSGLTSKFSVGNLNNLPVFVETIGPFKEEGLHEQYDELASEFYQTGTSIEAVGFGLASKLKSKIAVRFKLPIAAPTILPGANASLHYYNAESLTFEKVSEDGPATDNAFFETTYMAMDSKMFGPFGNFVLSGSNVPYYGLYIPKSEINKVKSSLNDALLYHHDVHFQQTSTSVLTDPAYNPGTKHRIKLSNHITQPFLIEKAVIEFPIEAGSTWFDDRTQVMPNNSFDNIPDAGGPCITFGIINSAGLSRRDLVLSATLIPTGDNFTGPQDFISASNNYRAIMGFRSFATPSAVITPSVDSTFTGTVIMQATVNVRNSLMSVGAPDKALRRWAASTFKESFISAIDPFGRGSVSEPCGRSIYGKEFTAPQNKNVDAWNSFSINKRLFGDEPSGLSYYPEVYLYDSNVPSPYLVFPDDELVFVISKHRPVISVDANFNSLLAPTGSHDIKIAAGNLQITLYGSLLRQGIESNDGHNPNVTSDAVHEIIGAELPHDEYDIFYREELRGSYTADYVSGNIFDNSPTGRGLWKSSIDSNVTDKLSFLSRASDQRRFIYQLVSFRRYVEANSTTERYYDSIVPPIDKIIENGRVPSKLYSWQLLDLAGEQNVIVLNLDSNQYTSVFQNHSSLDWSRSFPFEPRYSNVKRASIQRFFIPDSFSGGTFNEYGQTVYFSDNFVLDVGDGDGTSKVGFDLVDPGPQKIGLRNDITLKSVYGIGDYNNCYNSFVGPLLKSFGATDRPTMIDGAGVKNGYVGVDIRGWKYGLISALPQYSKVICRRDRYGQFRDMLEQRLDTKYFVIIDPNDPYSNLSKKNNNFVSTSPVNVKFVNILGSIVQPEDTFSSNLSFEATASLPYFDNRIRNRPDVTNYEVITNFVHIMPEPILKFTFPVPAPTFPSPVLPAPAAPSAEPVPQPSPGPPPGVHVFRGPNVWAG